MEMVMACLSMEETFLHLYDRENGKKGDKVGVIRQAGTKSCKILGFH